MNSLFIKLYLDENVDILVAQILKTYDYDVLTSLDAGKLKISDEEQLAFAVEERRALLTHNIKDYQKLAESYFENNKLHHGILLSSFHTPHDMVKRLLVIMNRVTAEEMKNQIRFI